MPIVGTGTGTRTEVSTPNWSVRPLEYNPDPYRLMPEIAYRSYHQQAAIQKAGGAGGGGGTARSAAPSAPRYEQLAGPGEGSIGKSALPYDVQMQMLALRQAKAAEADPANQIATFSKLVGVPGGSQGYMPAQPGDAGAVASGYLPRGYAAPQRPQNALISPEYGGGGFGRSQPRAGGPNGAGEPSGDAQWEAYWRRVQAMTGAYDAPGSSSKIQPRRPEEMGVTGYSSK